MTYKLVRTHDKDLYLSENRYDQPKEIFKVLVQKMQAAGLDLSGQHAIADLGCAAGEFLYYLNSQFKNAKLHGIEVVPELAEKAKKAVSNADIRVGSLLESSLLGTQSLDAITMCGVHSIFDDFRPLFSNLLSWIKPQGTALIFGLFNPQPIDVWVHYRKADDTNTSVRESGWNNFSCSSVSQFLQKHPRVLSHSFETFEMPFKIEPNADDPLRTWTVESDAGRLFVNGLSIICPLQILEIKLK